MHEGDLSYVVIAAAAPIDPDVRAEHNSTGLIRNIPQRKCATKESIVVSAMPPSSGVWSTLTVIAESGCSDSTMRAVTIACVGSAGGWDSDTIGEEILRDNSTRTLGLLLSVSFESGQESANCLWKDDSKGSTRLTGT